MGMTMTQKILAAHAGLESVTAGQLIEAKLDMVLGNDITSPVAIQEFEKAGFQQVFDRTKISLVMDHFAPNKDIKAAQQTKQSREFANKYDILNFYDVGSMGIEHALLPEKGLVGAGDCVIEPTAIPVPMVHWESSPLVLAAPIWQQAWQQAPIDIRIASAIRFNLVGQLSGWASGKDVILTIIGMIGVDGALYKSMEFTGSGLASLSMDDRLCMANMAIEAGAKNGIFEVDDITIAYMKDRVQKPYTIYQADPDAQYDAEYTIDLSTIVPTVAYPHLPENTHPASESKHISIDQVVIGSCTNGRSSDMEIAAKILKGKKIAKNVRAIVIPATQKIFTECIQKGWMETFVEAGCVVSTPTCGPCLGGYMGILAQGERCVATTNRNFVGRMGHVESEVYLASPAVAAASALTGYITAPKEEN